jgi:hypothetical protein
MKAEFKLKTATVVDYVLLAVLVGLFVCIVLDMDLTTVVWKTGLGILNVFLVIYAVADTVIVLLLIAALIIAWLLVHTSSMDDMVKTNKFFNDDINKEQNKFVHFLNNVKYIVVIILCFYLKQPDILGLRTGYIGVLYCISFVLIQIFAYITPRCVAKITKLMLLGKTQSE